MLGLFFVRCFEQALNRLFNRFTSSIFQCFNGFCLAPSKRKWLTSNNPVVCSRFYAPKILWFCYGWEERLSDTGGKESYLEWDQWNGLIDESPPTILMRLAFSFEQIFKAFSLFLVIFKWFDELLFIEPTQRKLAPYKYVMIIERCFLFPSPFISWKTGTVNAWQRTLRPFTDLYILLIESTNLIAKIYTHHSCFFPIWIYIYI